MLDYPSSRGVRVGMDIDMYCIYCNICGIIDKVGLIYACSCLINDNAIHNITFISWKQRDVLCDYPSREMRGVSDRDTIHQPRSHSTTSRKKTSLTNFKHLIPAIGCGAAFAIGFGLILTSSPTF